MDESVPEITSITKEQAIVTTQKKMSSDIMTAEEIKKELARIKREALPGKCPIRFHEIDTEKIDWEHPILRETYEKLTDALKHLTATTDSTIAEEIFTTGLDALPSKNAPRKANLAAQTLADAAPHDATEARLCMQEMALYAQGMHQLSIARNCSMIPQAEFHTKTAIKLLRLHNETVEARSKYRRGGEQKVTVQHVQVSEGGQAIVNNGNMTAGGGGGKEKMSEVIP